MSRNSTTLQVPTIPVKTAPTISRPTAEDIAVCAHQIFFERGGTPGQELDDWLQAERELNAAAEGLKPSRIDAPSPMPLPNPRSSR